MRLAAAGLALALAIAAPASAIDPQQIFVETKLLLVERISFPLDFKLGCEHTVSFDIENPSLIQPYNTPATTKKPSFEFMITSFGTTLVTANFVGAGGNCVGAASSSILLTLKPELSNEIKIFGKAGKDLSKQGKSLKKQELDYLEDRLRDVIADYEDGFISWDDAVADMFGYAVSSQLYVAAQLEGGLSGLGDLGSSLLQSAGAIGIPAALMTGSKGSLWGAAQGATRGCYAEFVADVQDLLCDALAYLATTEPDSNPRFNVKLRKKLPILARVPRLTDDPDDEPVRPIRWLGLLAYSGTEGSGLIGAAAGVLGGATNAKVRAIGPGSRDQTIILPQMMDTRQELLLFITPRIIQSSTVSGPLGGPPPAVTPAPGNWRFELSYEADTNPSDIARITSP
jgi:hypothetical protein